MKAVAVVCISEWELRNESVEWVSFIYFIHSDVGLMKKRHSGICSCALLVCRIVCLGSSDNFKDGIG